MQIFEEKKLSASKFVKNGAENSKKPWSNDVVVSMDCSGLPCDDMICINMSKHSFQEETHFFFHQVP